MKRGLAIPASAMIVAEVVRLLDKP